MGIPYVDASSEAEAQCAALVRAGKVRRSVGRTMARHRRGASWLRGGPACTGCRPTRARTRAVQAFATGTEDMDALTFGSGVLLRHLTFSEVPRCRIVAGRGSAPSCGSDAVAAVVPAAQARKMPIKEFTLATALRDLDLSMESFVDLCILLGCDYCQSIRGIGPTRAISLIKQHKSIDEVIKHLDTDKYSVPDDWPYAEARRLFLHPDVRDPATIEVRPLRCAVDGARRAGDPAMRNNGRGARNS